jgi:hypothetical protein
MMHDSLDDTSKQQRNATALRSTVLLARGRCASPAAGLHHTAVCCARGVMRGAAAGARGRVSTARALAANTARRGGAAPARAPSGAGGARAAHSSVRAHHAAARRAQPVALAPPKHHARGAVRAAAAADGDGDAGAAPEPAATFAELVLAEVGVPAARVAGTLLAAAALHAAPAEDRPLLHLTAELPSVTADGGAAADGEGDAPTGSSSAGVPPFASALPAVRDGWAATVRSHATFLTGSLGLSVEEAGALLASFPLALLLPRDGLRPAADFLGALGLTPAELACVARAAPRLLGFAPVEHLAPAVAYLEGCGLGRPALLGMLRAQPALALGAVEHKTRTDRAAVALRAAYQLQAEERTSWAVEQASAARRGLTRRGW